MTMRTIRDNTLKLLTHCGQDQHLISLPLLDSDLKIRSIRQIWSRLFALHAIVALSCDYKSRHSLIQKWVTLNEDWCVLSEMELTYLKSSKSNENIEFQYQVECIYTIMWFLGFYKNLELNLEIPDDLITKLPRISFLTMASDYVQEQRINTKSKESVLINLDYYYCAHNLYLNGVELGGKKTSKVNNYYFLIPNRRKTLEWILSEKNWDEIELDT